MVLLQSGNLRQRLRSSGHCSEMQADLDVDLIPDQPAEAAVSDVALDGTSCSSLVWVERTPDSAPAATPTSNCPLDGLSDSAVGDRGCNYSAQWALGKKSSPFAL